MRKQESFLEFQPDERVVITLPSPSEGEDNNTMVSWIMNNTAQPHRGKNLESSHIILTYERQNHAAIN